jgi:hypothetical protein
MYLRILVFMLPPVGNRGRASAPIVNCLMMRTAQLYDALWHRESMAAHAFVGSLAAARDA